MTIFKEIKKKWKPRKKTSHKGDFGRVLIIAGSTGYTGAAHLAGLGALRSGAGLITLACPDKIYPVLARRELEVMVRPFPSTSEGSFSFNALKKLLKYSEAQDVVAIGPGLSQNSETRKLIQFFISRCRQPLVIDADAINALKNCPKILKKVKNQAILTPHPGEFLRVFGGKLTDRDQDRKKRALEIAKQYNVMMVLKGHKTVVASPADKSYVNSTGNPGMASGGVGDALTGIIAGLIGQKFSLWDAARFGVYLHGAAGDLVARKKGQVSMAASDLIEALPNVIKRVRHE